LAHSGAEQLDYGFLLSGIDIGGKLMFLKAVSYCWVSESLELIKENFFSMSIQGSP
jgi:hypothetical protein